ncbi:Crp/Fnr family transcriptional regulator [Actinosynnema sp. NPDC020468]|uniref:Crp/Fnr family transcriptional regulator n=1 Tax=Actinosynnema sp. NPDC020468 TaxID=3154488 RepID=UPI0033F81A6D
MHPRGFRLLLGEERWQALLALGLDRRFRRGDVLMLQGSIGSTVLPLVSGRVKVLAAEADGGQVLLTLRGAGDVVGEIAGGSPVPRPRTATVVAVDDCRARCVPDTAFRAFLDRCGAHAAFGEYVLTKLSQTVPHQVRLAHHGPARRIAGLMLEVVSLADGAADPALVPFSQAEVAEALGLVRSTVARHVREFRVAGALGPGPRLVVADVRALRRLADL